jgi:hypothetical protein
MAEGVEREVRDLGAFADFLDGVEHDVRGAPGKREHVAVRPLRLAIDNTTGDIIQSDDLVSLF